MSNLKKDITAVLLGLYNSACDPGDIKDGYPPIHMHEAELQILNLIESVIGEDENVDYYTRKKDKDGVKYTDARSQTPKRIRNNLRAKQRSKLIDGGK